MAGFGFVIIWGFPHVGKEAAAVKNWEDAVAYFTALQTAGEIESFERVLLGYHGGDLNGFTLVRGDPEKLGRLRMAPEFVRLIHRIGVCNEHVGVVDAFMDGGAEWALGAWKEDVADLI